MANLTKHCPHCDLDLDHSKFYTDRKSKDGLTVYCSKYYAEYYENNKEQQALSLRRNRVKTRYGITLEEYDRLLAAPCAGCGTTSVRRVMDHCHKSGKIRKALCDGCNWVLGGARDNPETLRNLADYVESHREVLSSNG